MESSATTADFPDVEEVVVDKKGVREQAEKGEEEENQKNGRG